jgi:hypothetical protein
MKSQWVKITLRVTAAIFLLFAGVRFAIESFSSLHTEDHANSGGGFAIDHSFAINHFTIIIAFAGVLLFALSFLASRKSV